MKALLTFSLIWTTVSCARILGIFHMPSYSHQVVFQPIWRELSLRGHQVTVLTAYPLNDPSLVNLTEIDVHALNVPIPNRMNFLHYIYKEKPIYVKVTKTLELNYAISEAILSDKRFIDIYNNSNSKFDLVIVQPYIAPTLYAVATKLEAPFIGISSFGGFLVAHYAMGNPHPPSLYSDIFLPHHGRMTFFERFTSTLYYLWNRRRSVKEQNVVIVQCPRMKELFILSLMWISIDCARILGIFHMSSYSHHVVFQPIFKELSLRGHQVTVVTTRPLNDPDLVNLTEIDVSSNTEIPKRLNVQHNIRKEQPIQVKIRAISELNYEVAENTLSNKHFIDIYNNSESRFDVVLVQPYLSPILYGVAAKLKAPFVGISSFGGFIGSHYAMGNPHPPSLHSEIYSPYHGRMTFYERLRSTLYYVWSRYYWTFHALPECDRIAKKYLGQDLPYMGDIEKNMSLLMLSNPILYERRPNVPTVIDLEMLHVKPVKPLPKDLKQFLDNAKEGVIYFSLGSNVLSAGLPENLRKVLMEAFSELPYQVLWKFEDDKLPGRPKNVEIRKWLPQQDVLVFLTQSGLQSIEEAISRGVPMVGMPFISDQAWNIRRLVEEGAAVGLEHSTLTKEELKSALLEVINNPKYKDNVLRLQKIWSDQPMPALERAVWWIEYVIRHKGTKHLRSPTADVTWFEYLLVDVISVILSTVSLALFILYKTVKFIFRKVAGKPKKVKKAKQS
nr:unnamed protein product [Callosobruchus chinensis]